MSKNKSKTLLEIGSAASVDLSKVKDRIPTTLINLLAKDPNGNIVGYKMTDGHGIGFILKLKNGSKQWFFEDELQNHLKGSEFNNSNHKASINKESNSSRFITLEKKFIISGKTKFSPVKEKRILYLFNPITLVKWLMYSLKDVF